MANETLKTIVAFYDKALEQINKDTTMARMVEVDTVEGSTLQNANNIYWRNVDQQSPVIEGWDLTGDETEIIEQGYPLRLEEPKNDFVQLRVDELRDRGFMDRRVRSSASKLSTDQNNRIAALVGRTGSIYYESSTPGWDYVAEAGTILGERQANVDAGMSFFMNDRNYQRMGSDLASRGTLDGRPETAYGTSGVGRDVAGFDLYKSSYNPQLTARLNATAGAVDGDQLFVPEGFTTVGDSVQNVDYRLAEVALASGNGANFQLGDVVTFAGVNALGVTDKIDTGELMTFKVIAIDTDTISIYPKPIAPDQAGITPEQAAYANVTAPLLDTTAVNKVNTTSGKSDIFWANDSICIVNGGAPLETLNEFDGMKVVSETLDSGVRLHMAYDASLSTMNCRVRLFTWYGLTNKDPSRNGTAIYTGS